MGEALYSRFLRGLAESPDRVAVQAGAVEIRYAQAHESALRWAGALAEAGAGAVGVLAAKGPVAYPGILAALYAGARVVPLRVDFPAARTRQMIAAAGVSAVIADDAGLAVLPEVLGDDRHGVAVLAPGAHADGALPTLPDSPRSALGAPLPVAGDDPAYVLFTSGSTGRPKGVVLTHANTGYYFRLLDERYDFHRDDVFSQTFELNFDCSLFDLFCAWGAGARAVAVPPGAYRELPDYLAAQGISVWFSTPSVIDLVRRTTGLRPGGMPGLRRSLFAGEALRSRDAEDWLRAADRGELENIYGPTELTITVSRYRWTGQDSARQAVNGVVPIGVVHAGHDVLLCDDDGNPVTGEGELCIAGPQLTPGYLDPADGQGRFLDRDGKRWYRTGDRVRVLADGALGYLGRRDSQVQIQGWRVELAEVENALAGCGVGDAAVVAVEGRAGTELVAFYTGEPVAPAELARRLREHLPSGVVPKRYRRVDEFPLNANRKVDRLALTALATAQTAQTAETRAR